MIKMFVFRLMYWATWLGTVLVIIGFAKKAYIMCYIGLAVFIISFWIRIVLYTIMFGPVKKANEQELSNFTKQRNDPAEDANVVNELLSRAYTSCFERIFGKREQAGGAKITSKQRQNWN